jgi:hypothetical protein
MLGRNSFRLSVNQVVVLVSMLLTACSDAVMAPPSTSPAGTLPATDYNVASAALTAQDIAGTWQWQETSQIAARPFAVAMFGIVPEGPITRITCVSGGELTITAVTQTTFVGSASQSSVCRTQGGVVFDPVFPSPLQVVNGEIRGGSFRFDFITAGTPCPHVGAVVHNVAVESCGIGDCALPGATCWANTKTFNSLPRA